MTADETIHERLSTHGDFAFTARTAQAIKAAMHPAGRVSALGTRLFGQVFLADQAEALDMIATKLARIVAGDPNHPDHWQDIAGYAALVANRLKADALPLGV